VPRAAALKVEREVRIDRLGAQGDGIAETDAGRVFVSFAAPGDVVRVALENERGRIIEFVRPSPDRTEPLCRHFGTCGGCAVQHLVPDAYERWKREAVAAALAARGLEAQIAGFHCSPAGSRRRAVFAAQRGKDGWRIGFRKRGSRDLVPLKECPVLKPALFAFAAEAAPALLDLLPKAVDAAALHATAFPDGIDLSIDKTRVVPLDEAAFRMIGSAEGLGVARLSLDGEIAASFRAPTIRMGRAAVRPPPRAFLQATAEGEATLQSLVRAGVADAGRVADLFAGIGTFALDLAAEAGVLAVEGEAGAVSALAAAARGAAGLKPVEADRRDLFRRPLSAQDLKGFDAVVFDPPRAGAAEQAAEIAKSAVPRVVAVSCNAATFARDARTLAEGGYHLARLDLVDQFVFSPHIEIVAAFERS